MTQYTDSLKTYIENEMNQNERRHVRTTYFIRLFDTTSILYLIEWIHRCRNVGGRGGPVALPLFIVGGH